MDRFAARLSSFFPKGAFVLVMSVLACVALFIFFPSRTSADENTAPVVAGVLVTLTAPSAEDLSSFPSAVPLLPMASTTVPAWVEISVSDVDGWEDIDPDSFLPENISYTGFLKEDTVGPCAEGLMNGEDHYQCYTPISFNNCYLVTHSTNEALVSCPFPLTYFAKPGSWTLSVDVTDRGGLTHNLTAPVTVSELLAYTLESSALDFGAVTIPIETMDTFNKETRFANAGNVAVANMQVDYTDMACLLDGITPSGAIRADSLAYSTSSLFDIWGFAVTGSYTGEDFAFPIPPATTDASEGYQPVRLYHHLRYVDFGMAGSCAGTVTFTPST